jgi:hypothetical protein
MSAVLWWNENQHIFVRRSLWNFSNTISFVYTTAGSKPIRNFIKVLSYLELLLRRVYGKRIMYTLRTRMHFQRNNKTLLYTYVWWRVINLIVCVTF